MKTVRVSGDRRVEVVDLPAPEPTHNFVAVQVMASAIVGTERRYYEHGVPQPPVGVRENGGHEAAGVVWKTGPNARVRVGDRVALYAAYKHCGRCKYCLSGRWLFCQAPDEPTQIAGFHSQYALLRDDYCLPLPDDVGFEAGALLTAGLGAAYRAAKRAALSGRDTVLITGQGPLGLSATLLAKFLGARVIATDINPYRVALARNLGADIACTPQDLSQHVAAYTDGEGVDVALECSGAAAARLQTIEAAKRGGRIGFIGVGEGLSLDATQATAFLKEIQIFGTWFCDPIEVLELMQLVRRGFDPSKMVTHRFGLDAAAEAFALSSAGQTGKVVLEPWR